MIYLKIKITTAQVEAVELNATDLIYFVRNKQMIELERRYSLRYFFALYFSNEFYSSSVNIMCEKFENRVSK